MTFNTWWARHGHKLWRNEKLLTSEVANAAWDAAKAGSHIYRQEADLYHEVMQCFRSMQLPHGTCVPRERMACTHCNAYDRLAKLKAEYGGPRMVRSGA